MRCINVVDVATNALKGAHMEEYKYYVNCNYKAPRKRKAIFVSLPMDNYFIPEGKTFDELVQLFAVHELRRNGMNRCSNITVTLHKVRTAGEIVIKNIMPEKTYSLPYAEILCRE